MACLMKKVGGGASSTPITKVYILYPIYPSPIPSPFPPFLHTFFSLFPSLNYCSLAGNRKSWLY